VEIMKKSAAAAAAAIGVLAMATLSGVAFAGDRHGDQSNARKPDSAQPGQKPDNTTQPNTSCTTGGGQGDSATCHSDNSSKSDASKRYGNGKTAAQIANAKGAPAGTTITGPGNSQPHKICGRDVHAYKPDDNKAKSDVDDCNGVESTTTAATTGTAATTTAATTTTTTAETTTTVATTTTTAAAAAVTQPPASGVLGASKTLVSPTRAPAGVLGALKTLGTTATHGTLPFTGLRLWIVELIALGLIGTGVATRMLARRAS
jgi:hypothetical protein